MSEKKSYYQLDYVAPPEAPDSRKPPVRTTGAIAWLRENLFSSPFNTILTIVTALFLTWIIGGSLLWFMVDAEWNVVTGNLRLLMVGQYDADQIWRVGIVALLMLGLSGFGLGFWSNTIRIFLSAMIAILIIIVLVPWGAGLVEPPPIRTIAGPDVVFSPLQFVADEGQLIGVQVERITNEEASSPVPIRAGYIDTTAGTSNSRIAWTDVRTNVNSEELDLDAYDQSLTINLLDASGETIESIESTPEDIETQFFLTAPRTGWYSLEILQSEDTSAGYAWIRLNGVPTFDTRPADVERRIEIYGERPAYDCPDDASCGFTVARRNMRFEGSRTIDQYFNVQLAPFLSEVFTPTILGVVVTTIAFLLGTALRVNLSESPKKIVNQAAIAAWVLLLPIGWILLNGFEGSSVLPRVDTTEWGGLLLTMVLTIVSIVASFPLSILLALGRRSNLPIVSLVCTTFIEVVRGVPLITILFFANLIVPFFSDALVNVNDVIRMLIGLTLFTAAYQAEVIRGGLQVIPKGQYEAAVALGLSGFHTLIFITLPQALRAVIPAMMSQFVSLFKDTTLVSIVGLFELLGIVDNIVNGQQANRSFQREAYLFVGIVYFVLAYVMSQISRRLEETGAGSIENR